MTVMPQQVRPETDDAAATDSAAARAVTAASAAARRAGVQIRELSTPQATSDAMELFREVWRVTESAAPVSSDLMRALHGTGNYVAGVYEGDRLVGASVGFFTAGRPPQLHSHISGIAGDMQGRGIGFALKVHQRAWATKRGVREVTWTVDPLARRNVFFNVTKLGARVTEYLPDYYGRMTDGVNANDESDRLLVCWSLESEPAAAACEGVPAPVLSGDHAQPLLEIGPDGTPVVTCAVGPLRYCRIPADVVGIRAVNPPLARAWRRALRDTLGAALRDGYRMVGVSREGRYLLAREPHPTQRARTR